MFGFGIFLFMSSWSKRLQDNDKLGADIRRDGVQSDRKRDEWEFMWVLFEIPGDEVQVQIKKLQQVVPPDLRIFARDLL